MMCKQHFYYLYAVVQNFNICEQLDVGKKEIAKQIKEAREMARLSQEFLGGEVTGGTAAVQRLEYGDTNQTIDTIESIANKLGLTTVLKPIKGTPPVNPISAEDLGWAVQELIAAGQTRRSAILYLLTDETKFLGVLPRDLRQALEALDLG